MANLEVLDIDEAALAVQSPPTADETARQVLDLLPSPGSIPVIGNMSLDAREELVQAHEALAKIEKGVQARRQSIELAFKRAAIEAGSDQVRTAGGHAKVTDRPSVYETRGHEMREQLQALVHGGHLTSDEVDEAVAVIVSYKPDHRKLNQLARHRGNEVEAAIEENRHKVEPDPLAAKVSFISDKEKRHAR